MTAPAANARTRFKEIAFPIGTVCLLNVVEHYFGLRFATGMAAGGILTAIICFWEAGKTGDEKSSADAIPDDRQRTV